ncbi:capsule biosynthesis protein [Sphingomonas solaris]|uniref:Capsular biosynthesis protein n=1 Tax=Alterirhizorhabdus solaris TaxID=2529389 RepID=A0A558R1Y1_9SPHN|nr:capsular biosynthesis protein [Sphingomonas solaris]TVV73377.1 capsular biosynthesis protein [Sphingomonas solaris]
MKHRALNRKTFLFLQGPPGPFFARLADALAGEGHIVHRINFSGGDRWSWNLPSTDYRGSSGNWPHFFDSFIRSNRITDLVLFGDCRPLHRAAHGLAALRGLRIHVFEEGYIRPDWVTLELDGVNGNSSLSRDPDWYLEAARTLPPLPEHPPVASSFKRRADDALGYFTNNFFQLPRFPYYRSHRPISPVIEGVGWLRRLAGQKKARERTDAILAQVRETPYFVLPLQLNSDHQIRTHSPFGNMKVAMAYVIESFARSAPPGTVLVIKQHPLDNGLINWRRLARARAAEHGIADRMLFIEEGDIAQIVAGARGVVTVNSTTGTLALGVGVPVAVLGHAVYHIAGITHQGSLDAFWQAPPVPDTHIWDAFCRVLYDRCLIRGGFSSDEGLALLVEGAVKRLTGPEAAAGDRLLHEVDVSASPPRPGTAWRG